MNSTKTRGGARVGSGRPLKGEAMRVTTTLMMEASLKSRAQEEARRRGITFSDLIDSALRKELGE